MNRQSDVIENWEYGLLTLLNNALNLPVSEKNDAIEVKSIIEDVSRKLDSDSIQKFNEYSEGFFEQHKNGEVLSILENDIKRIENILTTNLSNIIVNMVTIVGMIIIFYFSNKIILLHIDSLCYISKKNRREN